MRGASPLLPRLILRVFFLPFFRRFFFVLLGDLVSVSDPPDVAPPAALPPALPPLLILLCSSSSDTHPELTALEATRRELAMLPAALPTSSLSSYESVRPASALRSVVRAVVRAVVRTLGGIL